MLKAIAEIFSARGANAGGATDTDEHELKLATAVLLVEIARADHSFAAIEQSAITNLLADNLQLSRPEIETLVALAGKEADHAASLQGFTRMLNEELDYGGKQKIVEMLWEVAFADDELSKFEDSLVRKLADLLYVSHGDQIRLRNAVMEKHGF